MNDFSEFVAPLSPQKRALLALHNPLSFDQQRLWFLDQLRPGLATYNLAKAVRFSGRLSVEILERSVNTIIQRHAVLRTTFPAVDG